MLKLGDYNTLRIRKRTEYGLYLDGGEEGNILLPNRYVTKDMHIGDEIEVFIYLDQDERTIATSFVRSGNRRPEWRRERFIMSIS